MSNIWESKSFQFRFLRKHLQIEQSSNFMLFLIALIWKHLTSECFQLWMLFVIRQLPCGDIGPKKTYYKKIKKHFMNVLSLYALPLIWCNNLWPWSWQWWRWWYWWPRRWFGDSWFGTSCPSYIDQLGFVFFKNDSMGILQISTSKKMVEMS